MDRSRRKFLFHFSRIFCLMFICITVKAEFDFKITPKGDIFLLVGSDLLLNCTIFNSSYNVDLIDMGLNCTTLSNGSVVNCQNVQGQSTERFVGNDHSTLTLIKTNVSQADQGSYTCMYGDPSKFTSLKIVHIGDIPAKPENLSCISNNYRDLECTFSLNVKPTDIPMMWRMDYRVDGLSRNQQQLFINKMLGQSEDGTVECNILGSTITCAPIKAPYKEQPYSITVNGSNLDYSVSVKKTFNIYVNYSLVKPYPVDKLQVKLTNDSSEAIVTWKVPRALSAVDMTLVYKIELVSLQNWTEPKTMNISTILQIRNPVETYKLTDLIPNTNYSVTITCKPASALSDLYWSEPELETFETNIDIPGKSVDLIPGSYSYMQTNDSEIIIALYWKNPSPKESHGDINRYKIDIIGYEVTKYEVSTDSSIHVTVRSLMTKEERRHYLQEINEVRETIELEYLFNISSEYTVKVWAGNDAGFAMTPGKIHISLSKDVQTIMPSLVCVEKDGENGTSLISWEVDDLMGENVSMVTVYYCSVKECKDLNWHRVKLTEQKIWINEAGQVKFAVSLETENGLSGGLVWQSYQFKYDEVPEQPIYSVKANQSNHTVLYVSVNQAQESQGGKPDRYEVVWQKQDDEKEPLECPSNVVEEYPVDLSRGELTIPGLNAGELYVVCVRSVNSKGPGGFGNPVQSRTSTDIRRTTPRADDVVLFVCVAVGGTLLVLVVIIGISWWCRRKVKSVKLLTQISDIPVDVMLEDVTIFNKESQGKIETKPPEQDSGTQSCTTSASNKSNHEDIGFSESRRWSLVSNDSYTHVKAKKRNSSSGLSGYLRVDGDNSGLTMKDENDSLISMEVDDNDAGKGKVNDYFNGLEKVPNVYHEIDDTREVFSDSSSLKEVITEGNECSPDVFTDLTPVKDGISENNAYVDEEGNEPKGIDTVDNNSNADSNLLHKPNMLREDCFQDYICETSNQTCVQSNEGISKDRYMPNETPQSQEITCQNSRTDEYVEDLNSKCNVTSLPPCDSSSKSISSNTLTNSAELIEMYAMDHEAGIAVVPQNVSDEDGFGSDANHDDIIKTRNNAFKRAEFDSFVNGSESTQVVFEGDEYECSSNSEFDDDSIMVESRDQYCDPDCISVGETSVCSTGSSTQSDNHKVIINDEIQQGAEENYNTVDYHAPVGVTDAISSSDIKNLKEVVQSREKQNGYKTSKDLNILTDQLEKPLLNGVINKFDLEQSADSNIKEKQSSESGRSYDSYVCAKLGQS